MPLKASSDERSGFEYYTKESTVRQIIREYGDIFSNADIIWLPFNSHDRPIFNIISSVYGKGYGKEVITNPTEWYDETIGCPNFWKWEEDEKFRKKILTNRVLVFDNPAFKGATAVMRCLIRYKKFNPNLHFILFSDSMTGLNKVTSLNKEEGGRVGYHILGSVDFDNSAPDKRINIALFSDLFEGIRFTYGMGRDPRDQKGISYWSERCNIPKYRDLRNGEIASAELINVCARGNPKQGGYEFKLCNFDFSQKCVKFGGCAKYNFESDEEVQKFNEKFGIEDRYEKILE